MTVSTLPLRPPFDINDPASCKLDLANQKAKEVLGIVEAFATFAKTGTALGPLPVKTGWNEITPEIAADLLKRNHPGANRKVDPGTVFYYASQMDRDNWKPTGQAILIDANDVLMDAQHRLYGVLVSGATIKSYVVTGIEPIPNLFAYIDNSRPRSAATALQTMGLNGVSPVIVKVIKIAEEIEQGVYNPNSGLSKLPRMSPIEVVQLASKYPNAQKAARSASSDWEEAVTVLGGRKDVVAYLGMKITDLHDEYTADDFFEEVADTSERSADDPIGVLHKLAEKDARADKAMKSRHVLAALIKVFNAWHKKEPLGRRWMLQVNEDFPSIESMGEVASSSDEEAA